jgi:hypothetical protein
MTRAVATRLAASLSFAFVVMFFAAPVAMRAQDNYEIQVYPSVTIPPKVLLTELHSNYTVQGGTTVQNGFLPTQGQEHETIELTQGIKDWAEVGFYIFTEEENGTGVQWVGDHIRPRVRAPDRWNLPVGLSVSNEIGYARAPYSNPTWSWQIMPIIDKAIGKWYGSVNTTLVWDIHSVPPPRTYTPVERDAYYRDVAPKGVTFGPAATITYQPNKYYNFGLEYYGYYGGLNHIVSLHNQQQQFFPAINLFLSPKWEINAGVGWGATASTDHLIVKVILGHYFNWGLPKHTPLPPFL